MRMALVSEDFIKTLSLPKKEQPAMIDLPQEVTPDLLSSLQEALSKAAQVLGPKLVADADRLAQLLVGVATPSADLVRERIERNKTIKLLTQQTPWFTAAEIQAGNDGHARAVADWKRRGRIFSVASPRGMDLYPAYQFDAAMQPLPVIRSILQAFGPVADPWTLVAWFHFPNGWLVRKDDPEHRPQAPKDFLDDEEAVVRAAGLRNSSYVA